MSKSDEYVTGELAAAYMEVKIHTEDDLTQLDKLPPHVQRTYYHEFIHNLQYNTTGFGLYYFWHIYDRLRHLLVSLPQDDSPIEIPIDNPARDEIIEQETLFTKLRGAGKMPSNWPPEYREAFVVNRVEIEDDPLLNKHFPHHQVGHVMLELKHPTGATKWFRFGEYAIMESMARLAEFQHYTPDPRMEQYPYFVAENLARLEYPTVANNPELLFALCDVSLMHPLPGWAFYQLLQEMKAKAIIFTTGEEVINFGLKSFALSNWRIPYRKQDAMDGIEKSLDSLFHLPQFAETKAWVKTVLEQGHELRGNDMHFFIKVFRDKPFTGAMNDAWRRVGGPHCINDKFERKIKMPEVLERQDPDYAERVFPQRLRMIWQIYEFLVNGKVECGLYDICNHSKPPAVDDRCKSAPWLRVHDQHKCPYAAAMIQWGLSPRKLVINGVPVDLTRPPAGSAPSSSVVQL